MSFYSSGIEGGTAIEWGGTTRCSVWCQLCKLQDDGLHGSGEVCVHTGGLGEAHSLHHSALHNLQWHYLHYWDYLHSAGTVRCERPTVGSLLDCNDPSQLISSPFLQLRCLPGSSEICKYSQELQSGTNPCTREMLRSYLESSGDQEVIEELHKQESRALLTEQFKQKETLTVVNQAKAQRKLSSTYISTLQGVSNRELLNLYLIPTSPSNQSELISSYGFSDLYTAARVWIAVACYTYVSTTILFFFVKYFSPQDSCFSFVRKPDEFFLLKILNVFTPWQ
ncbi:putative signal peptide-containing and transmembrane domain-containing protein [Cryptosporidium canis]|uniref:Signal peptide-containing and transmembrane domain-containing protein n=1 Tax=Cryptosporidium canis TaxID=195482 RepID=A0ABQ8P4C7_9CRYT|nr:putative signal peptide-containing and transmembrane domain-containing protein [Cryptosporidium canis]